MNQIQQGDETCCRNCRFSRKNNNNPFYYCCHRYAPHSGQIDSDFEVDWPNVWRDDWCGEFEPKKVRTLPWKKKSQGKAE